MQTSIRQSRQNRYSGEIDEFTYKGKIIKIEWQPEEWSEAPWEHCDCYGIVSDWGHRDKRPGEVIINTDHGAKRFYDFAGSVARFKQDGATGEQADKQARESCERMRQWCNDQWCYCNAFVKIDGLDYSDSLGMIESDFAASVIPDLLAEAYAAIDQHQRNLIALYRLLTLS